MRVCIFITFKLLEMLSETRKAAGGGGEAYTFQHPPQEFNPQYRDPTNGRHQMSNTRYQNLMYERRVFRGNTYANPVMSSGARAELDQREAEEALRHRQAIMRATSLKARKQLEAARRKLATPDPVQGRQHIEMQTEEYLEELKDEIPMETQETQTDPLMDRPPTPKYAPQKTGRDAETQIYEGDLFHFDDAVEPILEVMVGKTLEQAMLEVMEEEELELLRMQQLEFEQRRKEELLEAQRLESMEKRKFEEKERRMKQEMERIQREKETREKLQARQFAKVYMSNLENRVFSRLQDEGWFSDRVLNEVELEFMPWLMNEVDKELEKKRKARSLVDALIREVVSNNVDHVLHSAEERKQEQNGAASSNAVEGSGSPLDFGADGKNRVASFADAFCSSSFNWLGERVDHRRSTNNPVTSELASQVQPGQEAEGNN